MEQSRYSEHTSEDLARLQAERDVLPRLIDTAKQQKKRHSEAEAYHEDVNARLSATEDLLEEFPALNYMGDSMLLAPSARIVPGKELGTKLDKAVAASSGQASTSPGLTSQTEPGFAPPMPDLGAKQGQHQPPGREWLNEDALREVRLGVDQATEEYKKTPDRDWLEVTEQQETSLPYPGWNTTYLTQDKDSSLPDWTTPDVKLGGAEKEGNAAEIPEPNLDLGTPGGDSRTALAHEEVVDTAIAPELTRPPIDSGNPKEEVPMQPSAPVGETVNSPDATQEVKADHGPTNRFREKIRKVADAIKQAFFRGDEVPRPDVSTMREFIERTDGAHREMVERILADQGQPGLTHELLSHKELQPIITLSRDKKGNQISLSPIIQSGPGHYAFAIGYIQNHTKKVLPRLFYRSNSSGEWRVADCVKGKRFGKGKFADGYSYETKLAKPIGDCLEKLEVLGEIRKDDYLDKNYPRLFDYEVGIEQGVNSYEKEVRLARPNAETARRLSQFSSATRFTGGPATTESAEEYYSQLDTPFDDLLQEAFSLGTATEPVVKRHSMLGEYVREDYDIEMPESWVDSTARAKLGPKDNMARNGYAALRKLRFSFCYDRAGRVWISNIILRDAPVTSYGNSAWHLEVATLLNKPLEYKSQIGQLPYGDAYIDFGSSTQYVDITPLIDRLPMVRAFRLARKIPRQSNPAA